MDKLNALKNWMKPRWRKFVRYLNRLDADLQKQARQRARASGGRADFGGPSAQDFPVAPEANFTDTLGPYSTNVAVRWGYPSAPDHRDV